MSDCFGLYLITSRRPFSFVAAAKMNGHCHLGVEKGVNLLTNEHSDNLSARYASHYVTKRKAKLNALSFSGLRINVSAYALDFEWCTSVIRCNMELCPCQLSLQTFLYLLHFAFEKRLPLWLVLQGIPFFRNYSNNDAKKLKFYNKIMCSNDILTQYK